jgi:hypothetical protein
MIQGFNVLAGQLPEELLLVHTVFERFAPVDENYGDFIGKAPAKVFVGVDIDFTPLEATTALQFREALLDDLAQVAPFARIHHHISRHWFRLGTHKELRESSKLGCAFQAKVDAESA